MRAVIMMFAVMFVMVGCSNETAKNYDSDAVAKQVSAVNKKADELKAEVNKLDKVSMSEHQAILTENNALKDRVVKLEGTLKSVQGEVAAALPVIKAKSKKMEVVQNTTPKKTEVTPEPKKAEAAPEPEKEEATPSTE